jgi:hypothetical protein
MGLFGGGGTKSVCKKKIPTIFEVIRRAREMLSEWTKVKFFD